MWSREDDGLVEKLTAVDALLPESAVSSSQVLVRKEDGEGEKGGIGLTKNGKRRGQ